MTTRPEVVEELRGLFREGATPSHLIRRIAAHHEGDADLHQWIQLYFLEAFGVPIVRGLAPGDDYQHADLRYAHLSRQLLHEMVQRQPAWNANPQAGDCPRASWLAGLPSTLFQDTSEATATAIPAELRSGWDALSECEQASLQTLIASGRRAHETAVILAQLAEALQQRLAELEASLEPTR